MKVHHKYMCILTCQQKSASRDFIMHVVAKIIVGLSVDKMNRKIGML